MLFTKNCLYGTAQSNKMVTGIFGILYLTEEKKEEPAVTTTMSWEEEQRQKEEERRKRDEEAWEREQRELEMLQGRSSPVVYTCT